ncbi:MFS transporter [Ornithinibacillus gellani]|uniref:MFS transporter n=1 Tax=Ornithinibacillus gellani TaxID=2293253 RepID=UPI000F464873|nr:MFS transporter [Ornithinibacillus gellani]TQS71029.1 MFS transporter [Ornithinibacillus gellani]
MTNWTVWKSEKNYRQLFWSGAINGIGNRFNQVAMLALLYSITGSGLSIGIYFAIRLIPFLIFAPLGGMLADRFPKKHILIWLDMARIPLACIPLFVHDANGIWLLYIGLFSLAICEAIYAPTRMSVIPALVKSDKILYVNALEQIMLGAVLVVGSTTGGIIAFLFGTHVLFLLDAVTFLISAYMLGRMLIPTQSQTRKVRQAPSIPIWKLAWGSSALLLFLFIDATMPLANGIDNVLISMYALDVFHMGDLGVGLLYGALGLGFILSSYSAWLSGKKLAAVIVIFISLEGLGHILLSHAPTFITALLIVVFITYVGGISNIYVATLMMKIVPRSSQGAFFGISQMISNSALGVSMGAAGFIVDIIPARTLSLYVGITYIFLTMLYAFFFSKINWQQAKRTLRRKIKQAG